MNFDTVILSLQNQGPAFWGAALAIALGSTLLIISLVTTIRRMPAPSLRLNNPFKRGRRRRAPKLSGEAAAKANCPTINKTSVGYEPASVSPLSPGPGYHGAVSGNTRELTARLQQAANTLEEIRQGIRQDNFSPGFSVLKHEPEGVDYLFKTTVV